MFDIRRDKDLNSRSYIKNSTVSSVRWNTTRKLSISDCKIGNLLLGFGGGKKETITIEGIKNKSKIKNFNLETNDGGRLNIKNIRLHKRLGTDFWARDRAVTRKEVIFRNCDLSLVQTKFPPTKDKIRIFNLPDPGYIEEFNLSKHIKGIKMPFNYIIEDCKVSGIKIEFWGTKAVIEDSFVMFHCQGGDVQTVVRDCTVLNHFNYGSENISFENVVFRDSMKYLTCQAPGMKVGGVTMDEGGDFNDTFKNCHANLSYIVVAMKKGYLSGGIKFNEITMNNVHWEKGQITRKFPIRIIDKKGNPYSGKKIVINNKKVKTDKNGEVVIEFNFNKDNYNKSREVIIKTQEGKKMIKNVDFITDTPIILYLELDYPLNDQQSLFKPTNDYKEEIKGVDVKGKTIYYFDGGKEDSYFRNIVESDFKNIKGFNYQRLDNYNQYKKEADIIILSSRIPYNKVPQEVREKIGEKKYHSLFETYTLIEVENTHIFIVSY